MRRDDDNEEEEREERKRPSRRRDNEVEEGREERKRPRRGSDDDNEEDDRNRPRRRRDEEDDEEDRDRRRGRRHDDDDYDVRELPYPKMVYAAGVIWLIFGVLIMINALLTVLLAAGKQVGFAGKEITAIFTAVIGLVFLHVGWQSTSGTARGTLGNGLGSILFGLLGGAGSILFFNAGIPILGVFQILAGLGLLTAGIMALMAGDAFAQWKEAKTPRDRGRRRRRDRDDDDD